MTTREQIDAAKNEIRISARIAELRRVADDAAEHYRRTLAASGMTREHFRLRLMLLGRLLPPPSTTKRGG
jgi:hypothetical protein